MNATVVSEDLLSYLRTISFEEISDTLAFVDNFLIENQGNPDVALINFYGLLAQNLNFIIMARWS